MSMGDCDLFFFIPQPLRECPHRRTMFTFSKFDAANFVVATHTKCSKSKRMQHASCGYLQNSSRNQLSNGVQSPAPGFVGLSCFECIVVPQRQQLFRAVVRNSCWR